MNELCVFLTWQIKSFVVAPGSSTRRISLLAGIFVVRNENFQINGENKYLLDSLLNTVVPMSIDAYIDVSTQNHSLTNIYLKS